MPPYKNFDLPEKSLNEKCAQLEVDEARITYDLVCFVFLMLQLRTLQSWYFQHVILEYRAQRVLSSRLVYVLFLFFWGKQYVFSNFSLRMPNIFRVLNSKGL